MDAEPVADLSAAETLPAQRDGLFAQPFEVGVLARDFRHAPSVVRNADVRCESLIDSPFQAISGGSVSVRQTYVLPRSPESQVRPPVGWTA
ncbi:hypothetical protein ABTZ57_14945 [Streptomyces sp. NPDC094048]|uniref:hypothetical protein n=1 Tax=Streptomyces sp. NPDC094048 TaxID=3155207 RepID=UPI00331DF54C